MSRKNEAELLAEMAGYSPSLSPQEQINKYLGNSTTKYTWQENLNIQNGRPPTQMSVQESLWYNLKDSLGLTGSPTQYSPQELLEKAVAAGLGIGSTIVPYLLFDKFLTNDAAPLAASRLSEPGPGKLVKKNDANDRAAIDRKIFETGLAYTDVYSDPMYYYTNVDDSLFSRVVGRTFFFTVSNYATSGTSGVFLNIMPNNNNISSTNLNGMWLSGGKLYFCDISNYKDSGDTYSIYGTYKIALVCRSTGYYWFIVGGANDSWKLIAAHRYRNDSLILPVMSDLKYTPVGEVKCRDLGGYFKEDTAVGDAQESMPANGTIYSGTSPDGWHHFYFNPTSPGAAGDIGEIRYRRQDANNYMFVRAIWVANNIFNFETGHVIAGVETVVNAALNPSFVTYTNCCVAVRVMGNNHKFWFYRPTKGWTEAYSTTVDDSFNTATGLEIRRVNLTNFVFESFPLQSSKYDEMGTFSTVKVFPIGDSKTSASHYQNYLGLYINQDHNGVLMYESPARDAAGGATAETIKTGIDAYLAGTTDTPNHILINLGINDSDEADMGALEAPWKTNMLYIIDACHTKWADAKIYLTHVWARSDVRPPAGQILVNQWIDWLFTQRDYLLEGPDERIVLEGGDDGATYTDDGLHPNVKGDHYMAEAWKTAIGY